MEERERKAGTKAGTRIDLGHVPSEGIAEKAKRELDYLRSLQLWAENVTLKQANEALRKMQADFNKRVGQTAMRAIELYELHRQKQREWRFRLDKWTALVIIAVIFALVAVFVFKHPPR